MKQQIDGAADTAGPAMREIPHGNGAGVPGAMTPPGQGVVQESAPIDGCWNCKHRHLNPIKKPCRNCERGMGDEWRFERVETPWPREEAQGCAAPEAPQVDGEALLPINLERDCRGMCTVSIQIGGKWVPVIRDNGDVISHCVHPSGISAAIERTHGIAEA